MINEDLAKHRKRGTQILFNLSESTYQIQGSENTNQIEVKEHFTYSAKHAESQVKQKWTNIRTKTVSNVLNEYH